MIYNFATKLIARTIGLFSPSTARKYLQEHMICRMYEAAKNNGANSRFRPQHSTGAQEIHDSWQNVTNKIRALDRDNSHVAGMRRRFVAGLVGEGSWPRPKILKNNAINRYDYDSKLNIDILERWELWAKEACANGDSVYQLQRLAANHFFIDGGLLIRRVIINGQLKLEPIEFDQLDRDKDCDDGRIRIVDGKELDEFNKVKAYWIKPRHPAEVESDSRRIPAEEVIDLFDRERASSVSGISRLACSTMNFYNIGMYRADTMKLARVSTGYGVFIQSPYPEDYIDENPQTDENGNIYEYIIPGGVHYLRPGETMNQAKPENPGTNYAPFLKAELQSASVGAGMSYESVSNDGSNTNFSGARQMLLFERAMIRYTFAIFEERFYSKMYEWFIEHEVYFNGLNMPDYENKKARYLRASWSRPRTEWVDPLKDANAAKTEIDMGANTLTEFCETAGRDIEEVVATRKYEMDLFKKAGLITEESEADNGNNTGYNDQQEELANTETDDKI